MRVPFGAMTDPEKTDSLLAHAERQTEALEKISALMRFLVGLIVLGIVIFIAGAIS